MPFFFQAEDGIRDAQESRGLGDVYKRQVLIYFDIIHKGKDSNELSSMSVLLFLRNIYNESIELTVIINLYSQKPQRGTLSSYVQYLNS